MSNKTELILAATANEIPATWGATLLPADGPTIVEQIQKARMWVGPRDLLEKNDRFRQVIPYIVLRVGNRLVKYTRAPAGGEARLEGKVSVGVGGHIDLFDVCVHSDSHINLHETLENAANREFREEVKYMGQIVKRWVGTIAQMNTAVGEVHLGVVAIWDIDRLPEPKEDAVAELGLASLDELNNDRSRLEDWSTAVVDWLRTAPAF